MDDVLEVDFRPSRHGWHFPNRWSRGAPATVAGRTLGRVYGGLCGGMCVSAGQAWAAGEQLPPDIEVPPDGPLTELLWRAQLTSLRLPFGPLRYLRLQAPIAGEARRVSTLGATVPTVRRQLTGGGVALVGLVRELSWAPQAMSRHHVVLAYRLTVQRPEPGLPAAAVLLGVYDPNYPDDDGVHLRITADGRITHSRRGAAAVHALLPLD